VNFHKLSKAVVILDEPQAIRPQLWKGFGKVLSFLSSRLGTTFLLMTATKPHIVEGEELAPQGVMTARPCKSRYKCRFLDGVHNLDDLPLMLKRNIKKLHEGSGLVVLNTKRSALKAYEMLKDTLGNKAPVFFLSRWMTPKHRKEILRKVIQMERENDIRYLVSTQVVEAGVDLNFDWVFRDLGPLDSIIQVAGRCNRHFLKEDPGDVLVAELKDLEMNKSFSRYVYDDVLLIASREILGQRSLFEEQDTVEMVDAYFSAILDGLMPEPVWEDMEKGAWSDLPELIERKNYRDIPLYVELDTKLKELLDEFFSMGKKLDNLIRIRGITRKLQEYRIEVPAKDIDKWRKDLKSNFIIEGESPILYELPNGLGWFLSKEGLETVYSMESGFIPPGGDSEDEY